MSDDTKEPPFEVNPSTTAQEQLEAQALASKLLPKVVALIEAELGPFARTHSSAEVMRRVITNCEALLASAYLSYGVNLAHHEVCHPLMLSTCTPGENGWPKFKLRGYDGDADNGGN